MLGLTLISPRPGMYGEDETIHGGGGGTIVDASMPSYAPTEASGFPGDLDADDANDLVAAIIEPDWSIYVGGGHRWLDGSWEDPTRGDGELTRSTMVTGALKLKAQRRFRPPRSRTLTRSKHQRQEE